MVGGADGLLEAGVGMVGGIEFGGVLATGFGVEGRCAGCGFARDAVGVAEAVEEGFSGEMAGYFAAGGAAHAIAYDKDAEVRQGGACILVGVAHPAAMGEHGEGREFGGWDVRGGGGWDVRLGRLQSRSVWHFDTPVRHTS